MIELAWPWLIAAAPLPLLARWLLRPAPETSDALNVPDLAPFESDGADRSPRTGAGWRLTAEIKGDGGSDSHGVIFVSGPSDREPIASVRVLGHVPDIAQVL